MKRPRTVERKVLAEVFPMGIGVYGVQLLTRAGDTLGTFPLPDTADPFEWMAKMGWLRTGPLADGRQGFAKIVTL